MGEESPAIWEVIGGKDKGGIMVREGRGLRSKECSDRLAVASFVEELELVGERFWLGFLMMCFLLCLARLKYV